MEPTIPPSSSHTSSTDTQDQRLADLELFVKGVVHDLNNSLNVIKTNLYLLRQRMPNPDTRTARPLERIDDQVTTIRRLLEGHQAFYNAEHPVMQRTDLNEVVRAVADEALVPEGYELQLMLEPGGCSVTADPRLLDAALRALIRNSIRAMAGSGTIRVCTQRGPDTARLVVEDTGPGIPEGMREKVVQPFISTWPEHAGLGLALVQRIARAHHGEAQVDAGGEGGARVTLEWPQG